MKDIKPMKKLAVIPVYNETSNLIKVLAKFGENVVDEICIVIDCTTDCDLDEIKKATANIKLPLHVIVNKERKGVGFAIRKGIEYAVCEKYDTVVVMAGNNKDDPKEIPGLLEPILEDDYDYIQGSRFLSGGKEIRTPILRKIFVRFFPFMWTLATNVKCTDVTNGFRAYKTKIFSDNRIDIWQSWLEGYQLEYYIHYKVLTLGYKAKEVPVSKTYSHNGRGRYSKISPLRDWWEIVGPLIYLSLGVKR
jgi:dolichol-phosphate mannosyltransferase